MSLPVLSRLRAKSFRKFLICCTESPRTTADPTDVTDQILGNVETRITPIATNPMQLFV